MRILFLAAAALLAFGNSPARAQDTLYERAVAARLADDPGLAVELLEAWLAERPGDVDALVQYGYALLALGRLDDAERAFERVVAATPDYTDAREGLELIAERRAGGSGARRGFLLVEGALSDLEGPRSDWRELGLVASLPLGDRTTIDLRGAWYERFDTEDVELAGLVTRRAGEDLWLRLGASVTPSADFRPEVGLTAGADIRLGTTTVASLDARWQQFVTQDVVSLSPGITQYFGGGRFAVSLRANAVAAGGDDLLLGGALRGDFMPRERMRMFVGAASGPETDLGEVRDTTSLYAGFEIPISDDVALLGSVAREWREVGSDRTEGRIGLKLAL